MMRSAVYFFATFVAVFPAAPANGQKPPNIRVRQTAPMAVTYFRGLPPCSCAVSKAPVRNDTLERIAYEVLKMEYPKELASKRLVWQTSIYNLPEPGADTKLYRVAGPCLVLTEARNNVVVRWKVITPKTTGDEVGLAEELTSVMKAFFRR